MNKSHIELDLLGLCGFYLFVTSNWEVFAPEFVAKSHTQFSQSSCLYNVHYRACMFSSSHSTVSLSASSNSYATVKRIDYDKVFFFFN